MSSFSVFPSTPCGKCQTAKRDLAGPDLRSYGSLTDRRTDSIIIYDRRATDSTLDQPHVTLILLLSSDIQVNPPNRFCRLRSVARSAKRLEIAMADRCRANSGAALRSCQMYDILLQ